jgi:hypothetical protein
MIAEDYVSYETARLLENKGFDEYCNHVYGVICGNIILYPGEELYTDYVSVLWNNASIKKHVKNSDKVEYFLTPTLQMAMKWLREVHNLHINVFVTWRNKIPHYNWSIDNLITQDTIYDTPCSEKYEEACEAAIKYCLENFV